MLSTRRTLLNGGQAITGGRSFATFGIFGNGWITTTSKVTDKYTFSSDARVAGTLLGVQKYASAAVGNDTVGVFGGGLNAAATVVYNYTDEYTRATDAVAAGTVLSRGKTNVGAVGKDEYGLFCGGNTLTVYLQEVEKYTYTGSVRTMGTSLGGIARNNLSGAGNGTKGYLAGGSNGTFTDYTDVYTYETATVASGTVLRAIVEQTGAVGNNTVGIWAGGYSPTSPITVSYVDKRTYATDTIAPGTAIASARCSFGAAGNSTTGIVAGGFTGAAASNLTEKYTYSSDTRVAGTVLGQVYYHMGGC